MASSPRSMAAGARALLRLLPVAAFVLGAALALRFSWVHLAPVIERYRNIPSLLSAQGQSLEFSCRDSECVSCLQGVRDTPQGIIFTGGSSFRYAIDFAAFAAAMPAPVINCVRNDSRADAYRMFFSYAHVNQPGQTMLHGYNSWAINSPGTWSGDQTASFFNLPYPAPPAVVGSQLTEMVKPARDYLARAMARVDVVLLYAHLLYTRELTIGPYQWRMYLRARSSVFAARDLSFFPLSRAVHQRRRLALMRRWFALSPYVKSFIIDAERLRPASEIAERHDRFIQSVAPTRQIVFFPAPELKAALPDHVKGVGTEARRILLQTLAKHPSVLHVDVDYQACGLVDADFWHDAVMYFDIPHVKSDAMPKLTQCLTEALAKAGIADSAATP